MCDGSFLDTILYLLYVIFLYDIFKEVLGSLNGCTEGVPHLFAGPRFPTHLK